jgi:phosphate transport system permease protein
MGAPAGDRWLHKRQVNEVRNISISTTSNNIDFAGSTSKADSTARKVTREAVIEKQLMISAGISILSIILITVFIFARGIPLVTQVGLSNFLFNLTWNPANKIYGIGAMFIGSLGVTLVALSWAVPLGLAAALFIAEIAPSAVGSLLSRFVELLAGIPSVVYGFFGLIVVVPFIRETFGGNGLSVLAGGIILGIMVIPTIINISRDSIMAVPMDYKVNSLALGATHYQTIFHVIMPAARSGIITAIVLGMGRAIGETMAVVMVTGNAVIVPGSILEPVRTMTSNIVLEMGYASGDHQAALFATGMVLFVFIVILNLLVNMVIKGAKKDGLS